MDWRNWREWLMGSGGSSGLVLSRSRIRAAFAVAIAVDGLEFVLGPVGWAFSDEILDVVALIATTKLLGFHPLLLPTFILEMLPVMDVLPTWTGCVALVVALRKKQQRPPTGHGGEPAVTIDVKPTSVT
jgi:hypothetical protein